jgi:hypothetical protein
MYVEEDEGKPPAERGECDEEEPELGLENVVWEMVRGERKML